jgi:hypothetical protein
MTATNVPVAGANLAGLGLPVRAEQLYRALLSRASWPTVGLAERTGFSEV